MFAPVWMLGSWSWSRSWSRSRSRSRSWSWSGSGSGSRSRSWSWPWSGSGSRSGSRPRSWSRSACLPPSLFARLWSVPGNVGQLAKVNYFHPSPSSWPAMMDALEEEFGSMLSLEPEAGYYLETFGKFYVGRVARLAPTEVVLADASWVADTGRLSTFLRTGRADGMEVEPLGTVTIPLAYISAAHPWPHPLFEEPI